MADRERLIDEIRAELGRAPVQGGGSSARIRDLVADRLIDVADRFGELDDDEKLALFDSLDVEAQAELLEEMHEADQDLLLSHLDDDRRVEILGAMAPDDIADIVDDRSVTERERILEGLDARQAAAVRRLAQHDPDSAGGLMTTGFVAVGEGATVQDVKDLIRSRDDFESIGNIFVTSDDRLLGVLSIRQLILADNSDEVSSFMTKDVVHVDVGDDKEECYRVMETYHLFSLPVVDEYHNLVGVITVDDVLTVAEEEASEDVFRMAGSADLHPTRDTILGRVRKRILFLLVSVFGGFGSAFVLKAVGADGIVTDVAYFLPMVAMIGGNIAMQSSAVMVRGFATGEIAPDRIARVVRDELMVGIIVGFACSIVGAGVAGLLGEEAPMRLALAVMTSIVLLSAVSAILGTAVPSAFHRFDIDPAIAAGPFITGLIDMLGCFIYIVLVIQFGG